MSAKAFTTQPLASTWIATSGDGREPFTAFIGLYRDCCPAPGGLAYFVQAVVSGCGKTFRQERIRFRGLGSAAKYFRMQAGYLASDRRAMRLIGEPRVKVDELLKSATGAEAKGGA